VEAGNTTRAKLLDYVNTLQSAPYTGISKNIQFETNGNVKKGDVFVYEVKNGKLSLLGSAVDLTS
jgi:branched-chain amino acid transport system substrate-binding protein